MTVELDKADLVALVEGSSCPWDQQWHDRLTHMGVGSYTGGFVDKWSWSTSGLERLTEDQLWQLYTMIKAANAR